MNPSCKTRVCIGLWTVFAIAATCGDGASAQTPVPAAPTTTGSSAASASPAAAVYSSPAVATNAPAATLGRSTGRFDFQLGDSPSAEPVLVVPGKDVDVETVNRIIEDLTVMGRIIEKNSLSAVMPTGRRSVPFLGALRWNREGRGPEALFSSSGRPRPLYVAGYGAAFFIHVDFPLLPPPEAKDKAAATEEQADTVWTETRQALFEPRARPGVSPREAEAPEPYSRERVETLRSTLIAVMKHATNIRALEPGERLTIVVQGPSAQTQGATPAPAGELIASVPNGRSLLTLRASKADIDLYAKGELTQAQFEQRLQVVTY